VVESHPLIGIFIVKFSVFISVNDLLIAYQEFNKLVGGPCGWFVSPQPDLLLGLFDLSPPVQHVQTTHGELGDLSWSMCDVEGGLWFAKFTLWTGGTNIAPVDLNSSC
jgi:hypothetical protein